MIAESIQRDFNSHIQFEMASSYLYLSMAAWCEGQGLRGFGNWMRQQADEERLHVMKFFDFVLDRGGDVRLAAIEAPGHEWESPLAIFEAAYAHECEVSQRINCLVDTVMEVRDHAANAFLQWFVNEQVEEESNVSDVVSRLRLVGDDGRGILLIDQELAERAAPTPDPA
jgi:ferritin